VSAATADQRERLWAALGEPSRLHVLDALLDRGDATPTMLARGLPLTRQAVTKHLAVLGRVGLVASRRQGREVRYAVDPERLAEAARTVSAVAAQWDRRLARIKAIAEAVHARRQLAAGDQ
jgi:ArsR family transcriptional regulator, cadmium/lead-responsive transcriptional repressor